MTTTIIGVDQPFEMGEASSIGTISYLSAIKSLVERPNIRAVWTSDTGFGDVDGVQTWVDRKGNKRLVPDGTSFPTKTDNIFGTKPGLLTSPITRRMTDLSSNAFMPIGSSWSVAVVAHPYGDLTANWYMLGNAAASGDEFGLIFQTNGTIQLRQDNTVVATSGTSYAAGTPIYAVTSWDQAATRFQTRVSGTQVINAVTALTNASNQMVVGGTRALPGTGPGGGSKFFGAVIVASVPVCNATYAADLTAIEDAITADFGAIF